MNFSLFCDYELHVSFGDRVIILEIYFGNTISKYMNRKNDSAGLLRKRKYDARKKIRNIVMTNTTLGSESESDNENDDVMRVR